MLITKERIYLFIIVLLLALFALREGCTQRNTDKLVQEITQYKSDAKHYVDKFGDVVATNTAIHLATQNQIKTLLASNDTMKALISKFKTIQAASVIKENTIIKEVKVPFETKIPCNFKPFQISKLNRDYRFYSTVSDTALTIDSLSIPNTASIIIGEKKTGFLGLKHQLSIDVRNSNGLMQVSNISGYTYMSQKKWYEKAWFHFVVGTGVGVLTQSYLQNQFLKK